MANNAIALQARAPQMANVGNILAARNAMLQQQRMAQAAQRQADYQQQQMELARSKETREVDAARVDLISKGAAILRNDLVLAGDDPALIAAARDRVVTLIPEYDKIIPSAQVLASDENQRSRVLMTAEQLANKRWATPTSQAIFDPKTQQTYNVITGGVPSGMGGTAGAYELETYRLDPNYKPPVAGAPAAGATAPPPASSAPASRAELPPIDSTATAAGAGAPDRATILRNFGQPLPAENMRANGFEPMSYSPEGQQPDLGKIVQTMMDTGVVSQSDVDAMRQAAGPGKDAQLAELLRDNNIRIMPNEGMPGARNAVYNPDEGAASMQEAQYVATGRPFGGRDTSVSPYPGSAQVPLPRVRGEAEAGEAGKQGVRVATEPQIAAGTRKAERLETLRGEMPKARSALAARFADMGRRVADIDYILARPQALEGITGVIEGRLSEYANMLRPGGQRYQDVQSRINKVKARQVVEDLQSMKEKSPNGSSLFGQVTEFEDRLVQAMAGLDQAQGRPEFESALRNLRSVYDEMGKQLPDAFNDTFGEVMDPKDRLRQFGYPMPGARKGPMRYNPATGDFE